MYACRLNNVARYFYSSTACVYNEDKQLDPTNPGRLPLLFTIEQLTHPYPGLKEDDAWPAKPQDTYGFEKLYAEEMCLAYARDFPIVTRVARYHNVYGKAERDERISNSCVPPLGPQGTWKGGREKAPAAFCRKVQSPHSKCYTH